MYSTNKYTNSDCETYVSIIQIFQFPKLLVIKLLATKLLVTSLLVTKLLVIKNPTIASILPLRIINQL